MKKLSLNYRILKYNFVILFFILFITKSLFSNENLFNIQGNEFTDTDAILSLLSDIPDDINKEYTNEIIKVLNKSNLFSDVQVKLIDNKYLIIVKEYPNIDRISFKKNERLKDDELQLIVTQTNFTKFSTSSVNLFINELKKIYQSFGYNNVQIDYSENNFPQTNTVDLSFTISEGKITKINNIIINNNKFISNEEIRSVIKSKTKTIRNIFANNNFKPNVIDNDKYLIINYYKKNGFIDVDVDTKIEYLEKNNVNIYFNIKEGDLYSFSKIKIIDDNNLLNNKTLNLINNKIKTFEDAEDSFSTDKIKNLENTLSSIIIESDIEFFEIQTFEKKENNNKVTILFQILPIKPQYTNQINIVGNSRTFDYVIRRELDIVEGDAIYESQIKIIKFI